MEAFCLRACGNEVAEEEELGGGGRGNILETCFCDLALAFICRSPLGLFCFDKRVRFET